MKRVLRCTALVAGLMGLGVSSAFAQRESIGKDAGRSDKNAGISFRLGSATPSRGYEAVTVGRDLTLYVSPSAAIVPTDIVSSESLATRGGSDMALTLTPEASSRLSQAMAQQPGDQLVVFVNHVAVAAGTLRFDARANLATMTGLSEAQAQRVSSLIAKGGTPTGPTLTVVPAQPSIQPGQMVNVDIFASHVPNLRTYQLTVQAEGGTAGALETMDLFVNSNRADYVFGDQQKLEGMDKVGYRIGVVLMSGAVDVAEPKYLGTFALKASDQASGTFRVNVRTDVSTGLWDADTQEVAFFRGTDAVITVGAASGVGRTDK